MELFPSEYIHIGGDEVPLINGRPQHLRSNS
jgi:N-acetyl-beta-hexosaminidase